MLPQSCRRVRCCLLNVCRRGFIGPVRVWLRGTLWRLGRPDFAVTTCRCRPAGRFLVLLAILTWPPDRAMTVVGRAWALFPAASAGVGMRRDRACRHTRYSLSCVTLAIIIISSYALGALGALIVQCREHGCDRTIPDRPANKQIRIVPRDLLDQHGELGVEGGRPPQRINPSLKPPLPCSGELGFEVEARCCCTPTSTGSSTRGRGDHRSRHQRHTRPRFW